MDKKTLSLTKEEAIRQHRKMWNWIANKLKSEETKSHLFITGYKKEYAETYFPGMEIQANCFLCEYSENQLKTEDEYKCYYCPLKWGELENDDCMAVCDGGLGQGLYEKALLTSDSNYLYYLSKQIAELPVRKEEAFNNIKNIS